MYFSLDSWRDIIDSNKTCNGLIRVLEYNITFKRIDYYYGMGSYNNS